MAKRLQLAWKEFGDFILWLKSAIILALFFFVCLTPLALAAKLLKKSFLDCRFKGEEASYLIRREKSLSSMEDTF